MSITEEIYEETHELIEKLRQERDEIKLRMHLASMEVRDQWAELERKWEHLQDKKDQLQKEMDDSSADVKKALRTLSEELKKGYQRIRNVM